MLSEPQSLSSWANMEPTRRAEQKGRSAAGGIHFLYLPYCCAIASGVCCKCLFLEVLLVLLLYYIVFVLLWIFLLYLISWFSFVFLFFCISFHSMICLLAYPPWFLDSLSFGACLAQVNGLEIGYVEKTPDIFFWKDAVLWVLLFEP